MKHDEFQRGVRAAAHIAEMYDGSSTHRYRLGDCILGKPERRQPKEAAPQPSRDTPTRRDPVVTHTEHNVSDRVAFVQSEEWVRRQDGGQDIYSDECCAICGRPMGRPLTFIRLSRTNDGEWWAVDYYRTDPLADEVHFGVFRLPIGPDCANKHPELAHAISLPVDGVL